MDPNTKVAIVENISHLNRIVTKGEENFDLSTNQLKMNT